MATSHASPKGTSRFTAHLAWYAGPECGPGRSTSIRKEAGHDQETQVWRIPALLDQNRPQDRQAAQSGYVRDAGSSREARAGNPVLQAPALIVLRQAQAAS